MEDKVRKPILHTTATALAVAALVCAVVAVSPLPALVLGVIVMLFIALAGVCVLLFTLFAKFELAKSMFALINPIAKLIGNLAVYTIKYIAPIASGAAIVFGLAAIACAVLFRREQNQRIAAGLLDPAGVPCEKVSKKRMKSKPSTAQKNASAAHPQSANRAVRIVKPPMGKPPMGKPQMICGSVVVIFALIVLLICVVPSTKDALLGMLGA